jgi:hypothetical protein
MTHTKRTAVIGSSLPSSDNESAIVKFISLEKDEEELM